MADALIVPVLTEVEGSSNGSYHIIWEALDSDDSGLPVTMTDYADRSVQVIGNFSGSASVTIQGSNDGGTTYATLTDPLGVDLTFTAAGLKGISAACRQIRPLVTAGDGSTDLDIHMVITGGKVN